MSDGIGDSLGKEVGPGVARFDGSPLEDGKVAAVGDRVGVRKTGPTGLCTGAIVVGEALGEAIDGKAVGSGVGSTGALVGFIADGTERVGPEEETSGAFEGELVATGVCITVGVGVEMFAARQVV